MSKGALDDDTRPLTYVEIATAAAATRPVTPWNPRQVLRPGEWVCGCGKIRAACHPGCKTCGQTKEAK